MMAAKEFQGMSDSISPRRASIRPDHVHSPVHIILDFESRNWTYEIQSGGYADQSIEIMLTSCVGALRRIIMNIVGNSHKYTDTGYILVQLRVREESQGPCAATNSCPHVLVMKVIDSGRGMSKEYMERKLFTPFAQEDSFSPGIGLGLSIV
jgi:signal transduction histidine kinase